MNRPLVITALLLLSISAIAQKKNELLFQSGRVRAEPNIRQGLIDTFNRQAPRYHNKTFAILHFESIPSVAERKLLSANGIELIDYIPSNSYTVTISGTLGTALLRQARVVSLVQLAPLQKMDHFLAAGAFPSWSVKIKGTVEVWISFPATFTTEEVKEALKQKNFDVISNQYEQYRVLCLRIADNRLSELAAQPYIEFVQAAPSKDQLLNFNSRYSSTANFLNASVADGGKGLNGEGITVGIGDNADVQTHIDFTGRLIDRSMGPQYEPHGHHTTGTLAGAGNKTELYRGYAPKARIVSQYFNGIITNASTYVNDYGMVVTNNSYGDNITCSYYGTYDLISKMLDQMAFDLPNLVNVFAAGNSGGSTCAPFGSGYRTVLGGYQSAKNILTVGATNDSGAIASFSSRGPVKDGRTKPEIMAMGQNVASTWSGNTYAYGNGTSMAAPAVTGGLALLYQRYRQLNGGADPKNGLMKALLCNGATDKGNPGPDYNYGYGWMNLLRSTDMMENNHYFNTSVSNGSTNNHTITIPANTAQLKVMLYWNDPAASVLSTQSLVNDLDLQVVSPSSTVYLPQILDTTTANVSFASTTGADHINNMEQVVIDHPVSGTYTIQVKGTAIAQNPTQEYFVVFDPVPVQLTLTAPAGGERLTPSTSIYDLGKINWDARGITTGTVNLELSADNGTTWKTIDSNLDVNRSVYTWYIPDSATSQALVRIRKNGTGETSVSNPFTILRRPVVNLSPVQCEGYISIYWNKVPGATDYEVMMLKGDDMKQVAITTDTNYVFSGLSRDSIYWVTVRARINGKPGKRCDAISRIPSDGNCSGSISDNDLKIDKLISPVTGRIFTSNTLSVAEHITVQIKNLDDAPSSSFSVGYSINGGSWTTENVSASIAAGGTYVHTFASSVDLSVPGSYVFKVFVHNNTPDPVTANDTAVIVIKSLDNQPIDLTSAFLDNMESADSGYTYQAKTMGLNGLDRYDFANSDATGRLRPYINSGIAYSGNKALTLDADRYTSGTLDTLIGTYNLVDYHAGSNDIRLDFQYNNHGQSANPYDSVWIRGDDKKQWIPVYNLDDNMATPGTYKKTSSIEVGHLLQANGQDFSTSFQVRWGQFGIFPATDIADANGFTFDDVRLYEVFNDLQMRSIDTPVLASCGLSNHTPIEVTIRNSSNTLATSVPVKYSINGGSWVTENISSIPANSTLQYSFVTTADLSATGTYNIVTVVSYGPDSFRDNDTTSTTINNAPVISSFPYLENFESGNGSWYSSGKNNSWEYGTPQSTKINHAASGAKAWKTRLAGNYNDNELSYLYSPCFNISGMSNPTLSFSLALDLEDCGSTLCDAAWVEYSIDGKTWTKLGSYGTGTNWYNKSDSVLWSIQDYTNWHVATMALPVSNSTIRLRFVMKSDPPTNHEGVALDDIHIYDNIYGIYDGATMGAPVTQTVSGNNWVDFTSGGKLIASVQPNNQDMGSTDVQAYLYTGQVRFTPIQYYHNRDITIKPANLLSDSVTVRFYFLDSETDSLINASGCPSCTKPASAYDLGVSKYHDNDKTLENGIISDNNNPVGWSFIAPANVIKVPFDKGYYAEFRVKDFSEFWLNNGGFNNATPLPVKLLDFTAQKATQEDVLVSWNVATETDVLRYEIELARGNNELQAGHFVKIGEVASKGNANLNVSYSFTDKEADKYGVHYYRLKIIDNNGGFTYSPVRPVVFSDAVLWQTYPNPSAGLFHLVYQLNAGEMLNARILDAKGSKIKGYSVIASGFVQKLTIDLAGNNYASGVYLLQVTSGNKTQTFKLYKQ